MQLPMSHTQVVFILLLLYFSTTTSSSSSHHKQHRLSQGAVPKRLSLSSSLLKANNHTISAATRTERAPPTSFIQFESQQTVDVQDLQKSASQVARCPAPTRIRVHQESMNKRIGLTKDRLLHLLRPKDNVHFDMLDAHTSSFSCVEGRDQSSILGTPGGDFGEFLSALNQYQILTDQTLSGDAVERTFRDFLQFKYSESKQKQASSSASDSGASSYPSSSSSSPSSVYLTSSTSSRFYFHTTDDALLYVQEHLHVGGKTGTLVGLDLTKPDADLMAEILSHMCNPAGQGCFYLKSLLSSPLEYYTSKDLVCAAVRAFFRVLWDANARTEDENMLLKDLLRFVVSESPSSSSSASPASASEQAWVNFRGSSACERAGVAPAFPTKSPTLVFVNHLHAARIPRRFLAKFFTSKAGGAVSETELMHAFNRAGERNAELTALKLGNRVPYYSVTAE